MNLQDAIDFATEHPVFWFADETGFYFQTLEPKDVYAQLRANPKVEVCFYNGEELTTAETLRVTGSVEFLDDPVLMHRLIEQDMPFLAAAGDADDPIHQIFRVAHGAAFIWGMGDMLKERQLERASF